MKKKNKYIRCQCYTLEKIFELIRAGVTESPLEGTPGQVNLVSLRLKCFTRNHVCAGCGIKGAYFASEKSHESDPRYHVNMYGWNALGHPVLMTKDHIIPKAKGGPNCLSNLQTMCCRCNVSKGATLPENIPEKLLQYVRSTD